MGDVGLSDKLLEGDKPWSKERLPLVEDRVRDRLKQLSARFGGANWLDGAFSAGDLMMVHVLQRLKPSGILDEYVQREGASQEKLARSCSVRPLRRKPPEKGGSCPRQGRQEVHAGPAARAEGRGF
jgi:glutathione S-transferase